MTAPTLAYKVRRPAFDEAQHPRDREGKFIETGAIVKVFGGIGGKVIGNVGGGRIEIEHPDGSRAIIHRNYLTVVQGPDGNAPDVKPGAKPPKAMRVRKPSANAQEIDTSGVRTTNDDFTADLATLGDFRQTDLDTNTDPEDPSTQSDRELPSIDAVTQAQERYTEAVNNGVDGDEADERAALLAALDAFDAEVAKIGGHGALLDEGEKQQAADISKRMREAALRQPDDTLPGLSNAPTGRRLVATPNPEESHEVDGRTVNVGDHAKGPGHEGDVVGFTDRGGIILRDENGDDWPYLPDANVDVTGADGTAKPASGGKPNGGRRQPTPAPDQPESPVVERFTDSGGTEWTKREDGSTYTGSQRVSGMGYDQARSKHEQMDGGTVETVKPAGGDQPDPAPAPSGSDQPDPKPAAKPRTLKGVGIGADQVGMRVRLTYANGRVEEGRLGRNSETGGGSGFNLLADGEDRARGIPDGASRIYASAEVIDSTKTPPGVHHGSAPDAGGDQPDAQPDDPAASREAAVRRLSDDELNAEIAKWANREVGTSDPGIRQSIRDWNAALVAEQGRRRDAGGTAPDAGGDQPAAGDGLPDRLPRLDQLQLDPRLWPALAARADTAAADDPNLPLYRAAQGYIDRRAARDADPGLDHSLLSDEQARVLSNDRGDGARFVRSRRTDAGDVVDLYEYRNGRGKIVQRGRSQEEADAWLIEPASVSEQRRLEAAGVPFDPNAGGDQPDAGGATPDLSSMSTDDLASEIADLRRQIQASPDDTSLTTRRDLLNTEYNRRRDPANMSDADIAAELNDMAGSGYAEGSPRQQDLIAEQDRRDAANGPAPVPSDPAEMTDEQIAVARGEAVADVKRIEDGLIADGWERSNPNSRPTPELDAANERRRALASEAYRRLTADMSDDDLRRSLASGPPPAPDGMDGPSGDEGALLHDATVAEAEKRGITSAGPDTPADDQRLARLEADAGKANATTSATGEPARAASGIVNNHRIRVVVRGYDGADRRYEVTAPSGEQQIFTDRAAALAFTRGGATTPDAPHGPQSLDDLRDNLRAQVETLRAKGTIQATTTANGLRAIINAPDGDLRLSPNGTTMARRFAFDGPGERGETWKVYGVSGMANVAPPGTDIDPENVDAYMAALDATGIPFHDPDALRVRWADASVKEADRAAVIALAEQYKVPDDPTPDLEAIRRQNLADAGLDDRWDVTGSGLYKTRATALQPGDTIYTTGDGSPANPVGLPKVPSNGPGTLPPYGKHQRTVDHVETNGRNVTVHFTDGTSTDQSGTYSGQAGVYAVHKDQRTPEPAPAPDQPDAGDQPPNPDQPTTTEGVRAAEVADGDRVMIDGVGIVKIDGAWSAPNSQHEIDYIDADGKRGTIFTDRDALLQKVVNAPDNIAAEPDENPEPMSDTQVRGSDLVVGSRIFLGGRKAEVTAVAENDADTRMVTVRFADRSTETLPFGRDAVLDSADDAVLPDPSPLDATVPTARPVLYTYQRRNIVALGLDNDDDPMVAEAARRIRTRQPLSSAHSAALTERLAQEAAKPGVKPQRQRMLLRLAAANNAASIEAGGRGVDLPAMPNAGTVTRTHISDMGVGDNLVFVGADGKPVQGKITDMRRMMSGRMHEVTYTGADGQEHTVLLTRNTQSYLMPDLPDPTPAPQPAEGRELVDVADLRAGDTVHYQGALDGPTVTVVKVGVDEDGPYAQTTADNDPPIVKYRSGSGPNIVRVARGPESLNQPRTMDLPESNPTEVDHADVKVGDWVSIPGHFGQPQVGIVLSVDTLSGENADGGAVSGHNFEIRGTNGTTTRVARFDRDEEDGVGPIVRLMTGDQNTVGRIADARLARERAMEVHAAAADFGTAITSLRSDVAYAVGNRINFGGYTGPDSALDEAIAAGFDALELDAMRTSGAAGRLAYALAIRLTGKSSGPEHDAMRARTRDIANAAVDEHLGRMRDGVLNAMPTEPGQTRAQAANAMLQALRDGDIEVPMRDLRKIGESVVAAKYALAEAGTPDGQAARPTLPDLPEGASLTDRVKAYKAALGGKFGRTGTAVTTFENFTLDDLEQGKVPGVTTDVISKIDTDPGDNGPGATAMAHLDIVKAVGADLDAELTREMRRINPDLGEAATPAQIAEAKKAYDDTRNRKIARQTELRDEAARAQGYANYAALRSQVYSNPTARRDENAVTDAVLSSKELADLQAEESGYRDAWLALHNSNSRIAAALGKARAEAARNLLAKIRPLGGTKLDYVKAGARTRYVGREKGNGPALTERGAVVKAMRYAETNYPTEWLDLAKRRGAIGLATTTRGYYSEHDRQIRLSKDSNRGAWEGLPDMGRVATHELGHEMERAVPGLLEAERAFLWARTSTGEVGSRTRKRTGTTDGSATYADEFPEKYTGKDYGRNALEVFTTGAESLFAGSPYLDDDFRQWLLGTMALL